VIKTAREPNQRFTGDFCNRKPRDSRVVQKRLNRWG
jgi:hypothetical protein